MSEGGAEVRVEVVAGPDALAVCHALRRVVFVEGQGVSEAEEIDGLDGEAVHFLAYATAAGPPSGAATARRAVGTARLREPDATAKAERVAVLASERGLGVGRALMDALEREAARRGHTRVVLNAQEGSLPFYEKLGYTAHGERFYEAGIPHRAMEKRL